MKKIRETTAFFNKEYRDAPDGPFMRALQIAFVKKIIDQRGDLPKHVYYADDCFVTYRNLGFLGNSDFSKACEDTSLDKVLLGRIWRIYVLAWTLAQKWRGGGTFIDCGTYNGKAFEVALRYAKLVNEGKLLNTNDEKRVILSDLFESPPLEAKKIDHGPNLHAEVEENFKKLHPVEIYKGELPGMISEMQINTPVTWAQIDLNSADADVDTFKALHGNLADGAIVVFDDYGFSRYQETQRKLDEYIQSNNLSRILEIPTGQGLYIHCALRQLI